MHLVDEADNKSRFLALIHTCGKWAVWTVGGTSGRDHTLNSKLPGTRLPSNYSPYLHWLFFIFLLRQTFYFLPHLCGGGCIETVYSKQLHNIHDAWRFDASAVTDMTQIASGSFSDETSCISIICVLGEIHFACQWSRIFSQKAYIYPNTGICFYR